VHADFRLDNTCSPTSRMLPYSTGNCRPSANPLADFAYHCMTLAPVARPVPRPRRLRPGALGIRIGSDYVAAYCKPPAWRARRAMGVLHAFNMFRLAASCKASWRAPCKAMRRARKPLETGKRARRWPKKPGAGRAPAASN